MSAQEHLLFCESPFEPNSIDPDFEEEFLIAKKNDFKTLIFNFEGFTTHDKPQNATRKIKPSDTLQKVIYRGWMLTPKQYARLYADLLAKNFELINSPEQYQNCHYLPDSLRFIESKTPKSIFQKLENEHSIEELIGKAKVFGQKPVVIKDYVKSEKHHWETACFVKDASDIEKLKQTIQNLINLRGKYLNEGIVIREFIEFNSLTTHSKSGMPLTEEYRLFFCNKKLISIYPYWDEGEYKFETPNTTEFEKMALLIDSNFLSMDIARQKNGNFAIIELGDGQVSGLPDKIDKDEFYEKLRRCYL